LGCESDGSARDSGRLYGDGVLSAGTRCGTPRTGYARVKAARMASWHGRRSGCLTSRALRSGAMRSANRDGGDPRASRGSRAWSFPWCRVIPIGMAHGLCAVRWQQRPADRCRGVADEEGDDLRDRLRLNRVRQQIRGKRGPVPGCVEQ